MNIIYKKIKITIIMILVLSFAGCSLFNQSVDDEGKIEPTTVPEFVTLTPDLEQNSDELVVLTKPIELLEYWNADLEKEEYNILLIGSDLDSPKSEGSKYGHNDTTMILQINRKNKTMKLVSFMRDMVVDLSKTKTGARLTDANMYGGPNGVKSVLKKYFDVEIDYYALVSFVAFEQIMMIIGDIVIDVNKYEVENLSIAKSAVSVDGEVIKTGDVVNEGTQEVNAYVALSYARDRHNSVIDEWGHRISGDSGRNYRQRQVIVNSWEKVKTYPSFAIPSAVMMASIYAQSDMPANEIITLINEMVEANVQIETLAIPEYGKWWGVLLHDKSNLLETTTQRKERYEKEKLNFYERKKQKEEALLDENEDGTQDEEINEEIDVDVEEEDIIQGDEFMSYSDFVSKFYSSSKVQWNHRSAKAAVKEFLDY